MRDTPDNPDAFITRISAPVRAPERADPMLADRVMQSVRAEQQRAERAPSRSWWRRPVTVHVTPLSALAIAAGVLLVILARPSVFPPDESSASPRQSVASAAESVHVVRFVLVAPGASSVAVAGDFNRWDLSAHHLQPTSVHGVWSVSVPLAPGRHEYAFVVDGTRWVADPAAALGAPDEFGARSSVLTVGTTSRSS